MYQQRETWLKKKGCFCLVIIFYTFDHFTEKRAALTEGWLHAITYPLFYLNNMTTGLKHRKQKIEKALRLEIFTSEFRPSSPSDFLCRLKRRTVVPSAQRQTVRAPMRTKINTGSNLKVGGECRVLFGSHQTAK